jgi:hypothetical protein
MPRVDPNRTAWGASPKLYRDVKYLSTGEANYAANLDRRKNAGDIRSWGRARTFRLEIDGKQCGRYTPDFKITHLDGREEYVEVKGRRVREFAFRYKVFRQCYPDLWLTVVDTSGQVIDPIARKRGSRLPAAFRRRLVSAKRSA